MFKAILSDLEFSSQQSLNISCKIGMFAGEIRNRQATSLQRKKPLLLAYFCLQKRKVLNMDVSKYIKEKNNWIFDETFQKDVIGLFVGSKIWKTNSGKDQEVFIFGIEGTDYMIMPFKVDYLDFVELYGTDTRAWEGHQFKLTRTIKGKYQIKSIEEHIKV